ncbi:ABC transporter ATP-binding protein [Companilactobacillus sp.]|jgi:sulfonate transport system ATP-binding protein|uniref:ABC transporter ATP-binding protein n=1 Tax=Companilactobacillus sp. TaxID=2767905 RepID=UPI0025C4483C|nr:ABC transporter ATP-binding protein [Companilactobacillus sp.]MCH4009612.1 ABC transporter ATP-binding protein [Companilactobacillus sp.]MCH4052712.1 ABC transporter ATP-binding protein [Companilactobacillus sp.]MCH4077554.1 ABC transporter ATP-binding protein [Companilactobacillus sp.]MCH4126130.1 ABC transporter ATP-binding protein [Companilactobacillus sp.]MCI1311838.1 ABC transporter ATP-binding protein [Companilactobacillus sp.]
MVQLDIANVDRILHDNNGQKINVLQDINLNVGSGEFISIIGPSGCGKTTLLRLISGLDTPEHGQVTVDDKLVTQPDVSRGYVFQHGSLFPWETIRENISSGLKATHGKNYDRDLVDQYIDLMGLKGFENAYPHQVSGGMAQRAALARSIVLKPELLLLDEPMGALDAFTRADVQDVIQRVWKKTQTTMILVTHDIDEAIYLGTRIVVMTPRPGKIKEIVENPLDFPRERTSDEFLQFRREIQDKLNFGVTE